MARGVKKSQRRSSGQRGQGRKTSTRQSGVQDLMDVNMGNKFQEISAQPYFKYIAGGIAGALLVKLGEMIADRGPEIGDFLRENYDNIGSRIRNLRGDLRDVNEARH
jgi:hypothetical protein